MISIFNLFVSLFELPFAILFDKYSSKLSITIGVLLRIAAFYIFAVYFLNANMVLFGQALAGIATAATSGTVVALVMNEVKERSYENMSKLGSSLALISSSGSLVGGFLGCLAFTYNPSFIWMIAIICFALALCALINFKDKPAAASDTSLQEMFLNVREMITRKSTILLVINNACALAPIVVWQIRFNEISLRAIFAGFFVISFSTIIGSYIFKSLKPDNSKILILCVANIISILLFALTDNSYMLFLFF